MKMKRERVVAVFVLITGLILGVASDASALPTFARKYRTSCMTCHAGFFKLNSFGEAFRQNGYVVPGGQDAALVKEEPVELGAEAWKKVFPEAVWPGAVPSNVPISFYAHQRVFVTENTNPTTNFKFPHEFKLFGAGTLGNPFSFWFEHNLQSSTLNRIFLRFNDLFSKESWGTWGFLPEDALNLRVGRLDTGTIALPLNVRRTISKPAPYTYEIGSASATSWDFSDLQSGFEANGVILRRFLYTAGIVNGLTGAGTPSGVEDNNDEKDGYYRVAYKFGGLSFDGREGAGGPSGELKQADNWVDNAVTIGQFGYWGTTRVASSPSIVENDFRRLGVDARVNFGRLDLYGAFVNGNDDRPTTTALDIDSDSWFVEADYLIYPWLQLALGYEEVDYDRAFKRDTEAIIVSLLAWPRANIKITLEGKIFPESLDGNSQFLADLTYAF